MKKLKQLIKEFDESTTKLVESDLEGAELDKELDIYVELYNRMVQFATDNPNQNDFLLKLTKEEYNTLSVVYTQKELEIELARKYKYKF